MLRPIKSVFHSMVLSMYKLYWEVDKGSYKNYFIRWFERKIDALKFKKLLSNDKEILNIQISKCLHEYKDGFRK